MGPSTTADNTQANGEKLLWEESSTGWHEKEKQREEIPESVKEWIGENGSRKTATQKDATTQTAQADGSVQDHSAISGEWDIFVPGEGEYDIWESSPNKERPSSFGDKGTTASASCYGDLIQVSRFLGAGHSGVFSIDQAPTPRPYFVSWRADELYSRAKTMNGYSYCLVMSPSVYPADETPFEVKWVHGRWPRYEFKTQYPGVEACFQYMIHDGVVLQQFTAENTSSNSVTIGGFEFQGNLQIRDLDCLDGSYKFNEDDEALDVRRGPFNYSHVSVKVLEKAKGNLENGDAKAESRSELTHSQEANVPEDLFMKQAQKQADKPSTEKHSPGASSCLGSSADLTEGCHIKAHAVASVITLYVNGKAAKTTTDGSLGDFTLEAPSGKKDRSSKMQIVIAYKLSLLPDTTTSWRDFIISAEAANINRWMREERDKAWGKEISMTPCITGIITNPEADMATAVHVGSKDIKTEKAGGAGRDTSDQEQVKDNITVNVTANLTGTPSLAADATRTVPIGTYKSPIGRLGSDDQANVSPKDHLGYLAWRHLEHILSVCAVPLLMPLLEDGREFSIPGRSFPSADNDVPLVALTCGDMSGHRITTAASYFAFRFLIDVAQRLKICQVKSKFTEELQKRIETTCYGHIRWLKRLREINPPRDLENADASNKSSGKENLTQKGCFGANYWVTGETMTHDSATWQPPDTMTDTALHVLKLTDFIEIYPEGPESDEARRLIEEISVPWLFELDRLDAWKAFAWPHTLDEGINTFRLGDQFWIWKALRSLYALTIDLTQSKRTVEKNKPEKASEHNSKYASWLQRLYGNSFEEAAKDFDAVIQRLSPNNVQRGILQRFTIENDVSGKRMLAVTRSARETRFLFHSQDTALFYGEDCGLFKHADGGSFQGLWRAVIEAQRDHEENKNIAWNNALRYALGIMMGTRRYTLNDTEPVDMAKKCVTILINTGGHDAFFSGDLDEGGMEPTMFAEERYRDFYYRAGFEINYILLSNAQKLHELYTPTTIRQMNMSQNSPRKPSISSNQFSASSAEQQSDNTLRVTNTIVSRDSIKPRKLKMKKSLPFTNVIYSSRISPTGIPYSGNFISNNIVLIEEEWLYNYPEFLSGKSISAKEVLDLLQSNYTISDSTGKVIGDVLKTWKGKKDKIATLDWSKAEEWQLPRYPPCVSVFDCEKQKRLGKKGQGMSISAFFGDVSAEELFNHLKQPRSAIKAKKRIIWLPLVKSEHAFACWAASAGREKQALSLFFDRHARYEKVVRDDTNMVFNEWQTELHLSFYVLVDKTILSRAGLPPNIDKPFPESSSQHLRRASISFRFDGDIFDRHWTCHFVECVPGVDYTSDWLENFPFSAGVSNSDIQRNTPSQVQRERWQRKVLELFLLNRILHRIDSASNSILEQVQKNLGIDQSFVSLSDTVLRTKSVRDAVKYCRQYEGVLWIIEQDLTSTLSRLQQWNDRERNRDQERPRWTRNDENKYRATIKKLNNGTDEKLGVLEARRDDFRRLKEDLAASLARLRDDREYYQNQNVSYFTYATVIFLPLGFATSFYSMGSVPDPSMVNSMVRFAAAGLAATLFILWLVRMVVGYFEIHVRPLLSDYKNDHVRPKVVQSFKASVFSMQQTRGAVVVDLLLQPSAQRISSAVSALTSDQETTRPASTIVLGICFAPFFVVTWLMKALLLNMFDLLEVARIDTRSWRPVFSSGGPTGPQPYNLDQYRREGLVKIPGTLLPLSKIAERRRRAV